MLASVYNWTDTVWVIVAPLIFLFLVTGVVLYIRRNFSNKRR
ncbi:hypothetical protein [Paenilisteria weihenstephanensis]|nr:hypothetical protein [Listeria weihenstephanensis]